MASFYKSNCSPITVGCVLYQLDGVTPVSNGYYSDGTTWWQVTGGSGVVSSTGLCGGGSYTAELTVSAANFSGTLYLTVTVTSGTTLDNLSFSGSFLRFTGANCTGIPTTSCPFTSQTLNAGSSSANFPLASCSLSGISSVRLTSLDVNGNGITTNPEVVIDIISGNSYLITGWNSCINV